MPTRNTDLFIREAALILPPEARVTGYLPTGHIRVVSKDSQQSLVIRDPRSFVDLTRRAVAQAASACAQAYSTGASVGEAPRVLR